MRDQRYANACGRAKRRPRARLTDQLHPALYLDALVQWSRKISAKIPHRRCRRTTGHRAGGSGICFKGDGRPRDQRPLFGGVQFQQHGLHHVEIYLENELQLRFPPACDQGRAANWISDVL